jgi:para-aminobenzoate synthetase / 4-amino-4-deoxychorismate lyase
MKIEEIINKILATPNSAFFYTPPIYGKSDSYLFLKPKEIVTIKSLRNLNEKLNRIDELVRKGFVGYSLLNYEAGYLFEKTFHKFLPKNEKLIQFFFYDKKDLLKQDSTKIEFDFKEKYQIKEFRLNTTKQEFNNSVRKIKNFISEGDTYQVNYTVKGKFDFNGSYVDLFSSLIFNQSAKYIAIINNGSNIIISLSPEMFFEIEGKNIISKPMKGTIKRGVNIHNDLINFNELKQSEKNKAENVMIVDMIRNDLGRISKYGSVKVKNLFEIEKYESVFQMISAVQSSLNNKVKLSTILNNIFPCASITGAPKIRTMEIINELEKENRGIYTGSIGLIRKNKVTFSVSIRTLTLDKKSNKGEIGLGSGIVWDSIAEEEYDETKLKGKFLSNPEKPFEIIETILVDNKKIFLFGDHLDRMQKAAEYFLFVFDRIKVEKQLSEIVNELDNKKYKLKITLDKWGRLNHFIYPIVDNAKEVKIIISEKIIASQNRFQYFKTTNRKIYDDEYKKYSGLGFFDVIFFNEKGELAEGAMTNIFVYKDKKIFTPPLNAGILNGIYRSNFIKKNPKAIEKTLLLGDLKNADKIILTNSVRKEVIVNKLLISDRNISLST